MYTFVNFNERSLLRGLKKVVRKFAKHKKNELKVLADPPSKGDWRAHFEKDLSNLRSSDPEGFTDGANPGDVGSRGSPDSDNSGPVHFNILGDSFKSQKPIGENAKSQTPIRESAEPPASTPPTGGVEAATPPTGGVEAAIPAPIPKRHRRVTPITTRREEAALRHATPPASAPPTGGVEAATPPASTPPTGGVEAATPPASTPPTGGAEAATPPAGGVEAAEGNSESTEFSTEGYPLLVHYLDDLNNDALLQIGRFSHANKIIDIISGEITTQKGNVPIVPPRPYINPLHFEHARRRYYLFAAAYSLTSGCNLSPFIVRMITAAVMAPYRFSSDTIKSLKGKSALPYSELIRSHEGMLAYIWSLTLNDTESFVHVADELNHIKRYQYTNTQPTYRTILETEAVSLVYKWLERLFVEVPDAVDNTSFHLRFLKYLAAKHCLTQEQFESKTPVGGFFKNVVAKLDPKSAAVETLNYSAEIVSPQEIIQQDYEKPVFIPSAARIDKSTICISQVTRNFLEVLCGSDPNNQNVLRVFIRNVLTAPFEGRNWQSALYLHGAPGTAKSVWVELLKKVIPAEYVQEFSRHQNQFTSNQLAKCRLLIVSDLTEITPKQKDVLKRVLGRDSLTQEQKYESDIGMMEPYCQTLIVSNTPPEGFDLFASDQAVLDKLIVVKLGAELIIPPEFQIANIGRMLDRVCTDIFNWAVHCKEENLQYFIRAVELNKIAASKELTGLPAYIQSCMYKVDSAKDHFTTTADIRTSFENYCQHTGENYAMYAKSSDKSFADALTQALDFYFGETFKQSRYSKRKMGVRPFGFKDLAVTNGKDEYPQDSPAAFKLVVRGRDITLGDPFESDGVVAWMNSHSEPSLLEEAQMKILQNRAAKAAALAAGKNLKTAELPGVKIPQSSEGPDFSPEEQKKVLSEADKLNADFDAESFIDSAV